MIQLIPYSVLNLSQLLALSDKTHSIVKERHPEEVSLEVFLSPLSDAIEQAKLALGSTSKEELTEQVELADARRDDDYKGLFMHIKAGLKRFSLPNYQEACERLFALFNRNGGLPLYDYSYNKETAALESLFKDLDNEQARKDLATINATDWLEELKAHHEAFKAVYAKREEAKANKNIPTDESAWKRLKSALEKLYIMLNAYHLSAQVENIDETIEILNASIIRALTSARQSSAKR